jgi:hypothetical protein
MTSEQLNYMTETGLLFLTKKQRKNHYDAANTLKLCAFIPVVLFFVFIIKDGTDKLGTLIIVCAVIASAFLLASFLTYKSQQSKLRLTSFETGIPQSDNYALAKKTLEELQWTVKEETKDFIEAYNPQRDLRTWGNEMVSIVLLDNRILLSSICNLDAMNQVMFTFGKNRQNIEKFMELLSLLRKTRNCTAPNSSFAIGWQTEEQSATNCLSASVISRTL